MAKRLRRNHSPAFKAEVALAAINGEKTLAELAQQYGVHPNNVRTWRAQLLDGAPGVFGFGAASAASPSAANLNVTSHHDLFEFISQLDQEMAAEYQRIRRRATEDPGTAGDQGEENWATLLRGWLPPTYHVVTKGRLISDKGTPSPQVDIVVLKPSYPLKLRDKKLYLAAGVAAAFECKTTLIAANIKKAVETCISVKSLFHERIGTPYRELRSPIIYGLLAHSHSWKSKASSPLSNVDNHLRRADIEKVLHPRFGLDLLCVADLATWVAFAMTFFGPGFNGWVPLSGLEQGYAMTAYTMHSGYIEGQSEDFQSAHFTPIGTFISYLTQKLAWEDPNCRDLADYYRLTTLAGSGAGKQRLWPATIYSSDIRPRIARGELNSGRSFDEWSMGFM